MSSELLEVKKCCPLKEIHVGKLMRKKIAENGHTVSWFAKKLNRERGTIYAIFENPHIHTSLLLQISVVLNYDFFKHFSEAFEQKVL